MGTQRDLKLRNLEGVVQELRRLRQIGYHQQGEWDLGQICRHLTLAFDLSLKETNIPVSLPVKILGPILFKRITFSRRKIRAGFKAPKQFQPGRNLNEEKEVQSFEQAILRFSNHRGSYARHPVFGRLSKSEWTEAHTIHAQHHLSFLTPK